MRLHVRRVNNSTVPLPSYMTEGAVGLDLYTTEEIDLAVGEKRKIGTGIAIQVPEGYEAQVRIRSSLADRGYIIPNAPGTIDSDYRGEIKVLLARAFDWSAVPIHVGDRIAQLVIAPVAKVEVYQVQRLSKTKRGEGGFGSTGS